MSKEECPEALVQMLYGIAADEDAPANSRLSAIKEILDRTVGRGAMLDSSRTEEPLEIVFRIEDGRSNTA